MSNNNPVVCKLGENIARFLDAQKRSKADLARALGVTETSVVRYCKGKSSPNLEQLIEISKYLNVGLYELLGLKAPLEITSSEEAIIKALRNNPNYIEVINKLLDIK